MEAEEGLTIPAVTQPGIVVQLLRGCQDKDQFLEMVKPFACHREEEQIAFDPASPTLAACEMTPLEKAKTFQRMMVYERLVPLFSRGAEMEATLLHYGKALAAWDSELPNDLDPILAASVEEVAKIGRFMIALFGKSDEADGSHVSALDTVMVVTTQGPLLLIKSAVLANTVLAKRVQAFKNTALASKTMAPEIREFKTKLAAAAKSSASFKLVEEISSRIPAWDDALPDGTTTEIVDMVQHLVKQAFENLQDNDSEGLSSIAKTLEHLCEHVQPQRAEFFKSMAEKAKRKVQAAAAALSQQTIRNAFQKFEREDRAFKQ